MLWVSYRIRVHLFESGFPCSPRSFGNVSDLQSVPWARAPRASQEVTTTSTPGLQLAGQFDLTSGRSLADAGGIAEEDLTVPRSGAGMQVTVNAGTRVAESGIRAACPRGGCARI